MTRGENDDDKNKEGLSTLDKESLSDCDNDNDVRLFCDRPAAAIAVVVVIA